MQECICVDSGYSEADQAGYAETTGGGPDGRTGEAMHFLRTPPPCTPDLLLFLDVLEHVADDRALFQDYVSLAKPGAVVLITVPAFRFLWSHHDVFLGHHRRYRRAELEHLLATVPGIRLERAGYLFLGVFPLAAMLRLFGRLRRVLGRTPPSRSQLRRHSPPINSLLYGICRAERRLLSMNRFAGLSVVALARKIG